MWRCVTSVNGWQRKKNRCDAPDGAQEKKRKAHRVFTYWSTLWHHHLARRNQGLTTRIRRSQKKNTGRRKRPMEIGIANNVIGRVITWLMFVGTVCTHTLGGNYRAWHSTASTTSSMITERVSGRRNIENISDHVVMKWCYCPVLLGCFDCFLHACHFSHFLPRLSSRVLVLR